MHNICGQLSNFNHSDTYSLNQSYDPGQVSSNTATFTQFREVVHNFERFIHHKRQFLTRLQVCMLCGKCGKVIPKSGGKLADPIGFVESVEKLSPNLVENSARVVLHPG